MRPDPKVKQSGRHEEDFKLRYVFIMISFYFSRLKKMLLLEIFIFYLESGTLRNREDPKSISVESTPRELITAFC